MNTMAKGIIVVGALLGALSLFESKKKPTAAAIVPGMPPAHDPGQPEPDKVPNITDQGGFTSPAWALAHGWVYDPTQRAFVPPDHVITPEPAPAPIAPPAHDPGQPENEAEAFGGYLPQTEPAVPTFQPGDIISGIPASGLQVAVTPVGYPVQRGQSININAMMVNRDATPFSIFRGFLQLYGKDDLPVLPPQYFATGSQGIAGSRVLAPGESWEVAYSIERVNFGDGEKFDLHFYAESPTGGLLDQRFRDVLYVAPWTPPPYE